MPTTFTTDRLRFDSQGDTLVADLFSPAGIGARPEPVVVVTGSWTTSKEQQANFYARQLASNGICAFTFDFRGFGQSEGEPRDWEHPYRKADDIAAAVRFLRTVEGIDPDRIGALGVCASAGYQALNAARNDQVRSLAMVAPWLHTRELVAPYFGGPEGVAARIQVSRRAKERYDATGEVEHIGAVSLTDASAAMVGPYDYYLDPSRGAIPEWDGRLATMSWEPWLTFDAISIARDIKAPVQMVHSREAAVPDGAAAFYDSLGGRKQILWTEGSQLDFYDKPAQVALATRTVVDHFTSTL